MKTAVRVALLEHSAYILESEAEEIFARVTKEGFWRLDATEDDRRDYDDMRLTALQLRNMAAELLGEL